MKKAFLLGLSLSTACEVKSVDVLHDNGAWSCEEFPGFDECIRWENGVIPVHVARSESPTFSDIELESLVETSVSNWNERLAELDLDLRFSISEPSSETCSEMVENDVQGEETKEVSVCVMDDGRFLGYMNKLKYGKGAGTVAGHTPMIGNIIGDRYTGAYVFLNSKHLGSQALAVIIHEMGHVLGLGHNTTEGSLMGEYLLENTSSVPTKWEDQGLLGIYRD